MPLDDAASAVEEEEEEEVEKKDMIALINSFIGFFLLAAVLSLPGVANGEAKEAAELRSVAHRSGVDSKEARRPEEAVEFPDGLLDLDLLCIEAAGTGGRLYGTSGRISRQSREFKVAWTRDA